MFLCHYNFLHICDCVFYHYLGILFLIILSILTSPSPQIQSSHNPSHPSMKYEDITRRIIAASIRVHSTLGSGFPEFVYQRALAIEFKNENLSFQREMEMPIYYRNILIGKRRVDFFVEDLIMTELKATTKLDDLHFNQAINYLEAYNSEIGLLINFGAKSLEFHRFTNKKYRP